MGRPSEPLPSNVELSRALPRELLAGFTLVVVILIATLVLGLANLRNVHNATQMVAHTYAVKAALQRLIATTVDAETGERGFIITGATSYLEPYDRARDAIAGDIGQVRALTADNREQQTDLDRLTAAAAVKLEEFADAIQERRQGDLAAAQTVVMANAGKKTMDGMRVIVARMDAREDALLAQRTLDAAQNYRIATLTRYATTALAIGVVIALFLNTWRFGAERRRAERERTTLLEAARAAEREAEHASRAKDEFLAMVSHELRTPLNAVLGWADMLRNGALPENRRERALEAVYANAQGQMRLIDDLLDISRIMSGKLRLERTQVDLPAVARAALDVVQPVADAKQIHIGVVADPSMGPFYADGDRLQQIFENLLSNAVKFTPAGGAVHMIVRRVDGNAECVVTDTGDGIPPAFLPSVFEPFRQADGSTTRRHGGLGLGLSIVRHLVEAHGGTVRADSPGAGQGATFVVRLPVVPVHTNQPAIATLPPVTPAEMAVSRAASVSLQGVSVLVVDDDADNREIVAASLEQFGAAVLTAGSAMQALDLLKTERVHVLLADVAMPDEDGYALIRKVRALQGPGTASIPAAALTSMARAEDRQHALQAGFQLHLAKPIDSRSLVDAVATLIHHHQHRSGLSSEGTRS